jgi:SAM-dependent methyltransferase
MLFSLGFIEHFDDPASVLATLSRALRPGGVMVTVVPNFVGIWGTIQRLVDAELLKVHHIYRADELDVIHVQANLRAVERARYFGGFGLLVVNYTKLLQRLPGWLRSTAIRFAWVLQQALAWTLSFLRVKEGERFSSHVIAVYQRAPMLPPACDGRALATGLGPN